MKDNALNSLVSFYRSNIQHPFTLEEIVQKIKIRRWLYRLIRWLSAWAWADECRKLTERKTVHQWLNTRGIPSIEATGKPMCLLRRLAVALDIAKHHAPPLK